MKFDYQDKIDLYLLDRMSEPDRLLFEKELSVNPVLREQYDFTLNLHKAIKSRNIKLKQMEDLEEIRKTHGRRKIIRRKWKRIIFLSTGVAASVALFVLFINPQFFNNESLQTLPNSVNTSTQFDFDYSAEVDSTGLNDCKDSVNMVERDTIFEGNDVDSIFINDYRWTND